MGDLALDQRLRDDPDGARRRRPIAASATAPISPTLAAAVDELRGPRPASARPSSSAAARVGRVGAGAGAGEHADPSHGAAAYARIAWRVVSKRMPTSVPQDIFKAYDVRGLYGEQIDGDVAERIGRAFARVLARPARQAASRAADRPRARHAPDRARAGRALPRRHGRRGRARARRRDGRHRDALFPRRLARARRRPDVHRLAQPEGLHGREAGRARARSRCRATAASARSASWSRPGCRRRRRASRAASRRSTSIAAFQRGRAGVHRPASVRPMKVVRRRRQRHGRPDGRPVLDGCRSSWSTDLLDARRQLPRPRAQPAAAREPPLHHRQGPRRGRRPRHRLGRRRRPLLLHRRPGASSTATS